MGYKVWLAEWIPHFSLAQESSYCPLWTVLAAAKSIWLVVACLPLDLFSSVGFHNDVTTAWERNGILSLISIVNVSNLLDHHLLYLRVGLLLNSP